MRPRKEIIAYLFLGFDSNVIIMAITYHRRIGTIHGQSGPIVNAVIDTASKNDTTPMIIPLSMGTSNQRRLLIRNDYRLAAATQSVKLSSLLCNGYEGVIYSLNSRYNSNNET